MFVIQTCQPLIQKEPIVWRTNERLFGTLISIGDVTRNIAIKLFTESARPCYICHKFLTYKKFNLRVVETHVFYSLCFHRHLKRILYKRGWKSPYPASSKIKRRPTPATSTTPRTRLTDLHNSDNFHKQYYNHITPTCQVWQVPPGPVKNSRTAHNLLNHHNHVTTSTRVYFLL